MHFYAKVFDNGYGRPRAAWGRNVLEHVFCIVIGPNYKRLFYERLFYERLFYERLFYERLFYERLFYVVEIVQPNS